jgi:hypothetical protein
MIYLPRERKAWSVFLVVYHADFMVVLLAIDGLERAAAAFQHTTNIIK